MEWTQEFRDSFAATPVNAAYGPRIPDGKHRVKITGAAWDVKNFAARWSLEFPDVGSKTLTKTDFCLNSNTKEPVWKWLKQDLVTLGEPVEDLDQLEANLAATVGKHAQVTLITPEGKNFSNIYFNSLAGGSEAIEGQDGW